MATKRPNIRLITSDQQRADCNGFENPHIKTPHIDRIAREGTRFSACITPNLVCQPSRAAILTGMGNDGTHGAADIAASGGSVIAQDEATSVIWGMPGSAVASGVCSAVLPLDQIGPRIVRAFLGAKT